MALNEESKTGSVVTRPRSIHRKLVCALTHSSPEKKIAVVLLIVLVGSTLRTLELNFGSNTVLADKRNPFNQIFVKWAWAWTLMCVAPTVILTSVLYTGMNAWAVLRHVSRVGVAHVIWYTMTSLFQYIHKLSGECSNDSISTPRMCVKQGNEWIGVDISGHVFLLIYCILLITEETAGIKMEVWREYNGTLLSQERVVNKLSSSIRQVLPELHRLATLLVTLLELLATAEILLWGFMLCTTSLYFHDLVEKLLGVVIACALWYLTYRVVYGYSRWVPGRPGDEILNPVTQLNPPFPN